jgi:hypothetical protein
VEGDGYNVASYADLLHGKIFLREQTYFFMKGYMAGWKVMDTMSLLMLIYSMGRYS